MSANREDSEQMQRSVVSDLDQHCLPMSHKKDSRLIWVKSFKRIHFRSHMVESINHDLSVPSAAVLYWFILFAQAFKGQAHEIMELKVTFLKANMLLMYNFSTLG